MGTLRPEQGDGASETPERSSRDRLERAATVQDTHEEMEPEDPSVTHGPATTAYTAVEFELDRGTALGEYQIEECIGEGGMGTVFSAIHPMIGKRAAIKVLKQHLCRDVMSVERFIDEARAVNQIGHPNIVDIFSFGEMPDGRRYFAMEWLKGETLRQRLKRGRLTLGEMAQVIRPLARALEAAHEKGIVHRDLKPENVFLVDVRDEVPLVKLLDFGVAKLANDAHRLEKTAAGEIVGTPMYISPEQARDAGEAGWASDIYSLGAIAFELLTGRPPFVAKTTIEMVTMHVTETPVAPSSIVPEIPEELDRLILGMLAKNPIDRPTLGYVRSVIELVKDPAVKGARSITARPKTTATDPAIPRIEDPDALVVRFTKKTDATPAVPRPIAMRAMSVGGHPSRRLFVLLAILAIATAALVFSLLAR